MPMGIHVNHCFLNMTICAGRSVSRFLQSQWKRCQNMLWHVLWDPCFWIHRLKSSMLTGHVSHTLLWCTTKGSSLLLHYYYY